MDVSELKRKTDLIIGIVTAVCVIAAIIFLVVPRPTILFGVIVCIALGFGSGLNFGAGIVERRMKKAEEQKQQLKD